MSQTFILIIRMLAPACYLVMAGAALGYNLQPAFWSLLILANIWIASNINSK